MSAPDPAPAPLELNALLPGQLTMLAETFKLLGDPTRLRILMFCLGGPRSVGDIAESLDLSQTLVSHHLRLMRGARLMRGERKSRQIFYEVADDHVSDVLTDMVHHISEEHED
ncbi:MAG: ArsR/SmtB family transcription factor [Brevundimonas aurantiaca]|jgi:DNA-binding transcriptional ArsR family regulator|uniref:metalloregulator ArsR/SmtB family transcription factor n=1 Tax=Brevundimonas aurantiaca TaxID=74316 RepID=UPI002FDE3770